MKFKVLLGSFLEAFPLFYDQVHKGTHQNAKLLSHHGVLIERTMIQKIYILYFVESFGWPNSEDSDVAVFAQTSISKVLKCS